MRKIKMLVAGLVVLVVTIIGGAMVAQPVSAVECPTGTVNAGKNVSSLAKCNLKQTGSKKLMNTVNRGINLAIAIAGILAVVMIIVGGISMTTSAGDPGKVKKAKDTIVYGVIGLVIVLLAYAIVNFILDNVFNTSSTDTTTTDTTDTDDEGYVKTLMVSSRELNREA